MEKKKKIDHFSGNNISKTPEVKTTENRFQTITPNKRVLLNKETPSPSCIVTRTSPRRKSLSATPESSTKRELKKLEDYWTRNDPVKEDSPRLRSNRKVNFNIKDCFGESSSAKQSPKTESLPQKIDKVELTSLPESPIPERHKTANEAYINSLRAISTLEKTNIQSTTGPIKGNNKSGIGSPNVFTNIQSCFSLLSHCEPSSMSQTKQISRVSPQNNNEKQTRSGLTKRPFDNTAPYYSYDTAKTSIVKTELDTSSDSDDDDYIPPRKKLRSEVSKDELWDGIPLTVSFKRLAPITKLSADKPSAFSQIKKKQQNQVTGQETPSDNTAGEKETKMKKTAEKIQLKRRNEPKRSARVREKVTRTPDKKTEINASTATSNGKSVDSSKSDQHISPIELNKTLYVSISKETSPNTCLNDTEACSKKVNVLQDQAQSSISGDKALKLTLSQILSVESTSDNDGVEKRNEQRDDEKKKIQYIQDPEMAEFPTKSVSISISKTINDIFSNINAPSELSQGHENENESVTDICNIAENESKITRRSRRLSDLENRKSRQNSPVLKATKDDQEVLCNGITSDSEDLLEERKQEHTEQETASICLRAEPSSSKHKIFTKNENKCTKVVPPLRIKLKQPLKGVSKNNCTSRAKQKSCALKSKSTTKTKSSKTSSLKNKLKVETSDEQGDLPGIMEEEASHTAPSQPVTPNSTKKKPQKQRKCRSPPPTDSIALRLNNDRRLSAAGNVLSNPVLNKHACVLWSSENRRHMQLSNPKASLSELDAKLSLKWDMLSAKEKLRYFQRARDAFKDENRHSIRRNNAINEDCTKKDAATTFSEDSSVENFMKLTAASQMLEIKKWLNFYNDVSSETCSEVISSFKEALVEENRNKAKKDKELEKSKTKPKKNKTKKKEERTDTTDSSSIYRKILFEKILNKKENVIDILTEKKKAQQKSILDTYCSMLRRLVCGEDVNFVGDVQSDKLTETLVDVKALEKESKLAVRGDMCEGIEYEEIFARLSTRSSPDGKGLVCALEAADVNDDSVENICQQIQSFPKLSPKTLANHLPRVFVSESETTGGFSPMQIGNGGRTSPVTVLTELVADDLIAYQPQIGFRKAISLLSNKVVPSPTIILPPNATNGSRSTANKNQNCNIVFTKLQKSRPSVFYC